MAQWPAFIEAARPTVRKTVGALGCVILLVGLSQVECPLGELIYAAVRMVLGALPSVALAAWQAIATHGCEHGALWPAWAELSGCCWTALAYVAGAVEVGFAGKKQRVRVDPDERGSLYS